MQSLKFIQSIIIWWIEQLIHFFIQLYAIYLFINPFIHNLIYTYFIRQYSQILIHTYVHLYLSSVKNILLFHLFTIHSSTYLIFIIPWYIHNIFLSVPKTICVLRLKSITYFVAFVFFSVSIEKWKMRPNVKTLKMSFSFCSLFRVVITTLLYSLFFLFSFFFFSFPKCPEF